MTAPKEAPVTRESSARIDVDIDKCMGAGQCVVVAPEYFDQDDDTGLVIKLQDDVPAEQRSLLLEAVRVCPVQAIALVHDE